ncbi:magnesium/cobalt transporter CorA [Thermococcus gorgonarius]|uniref:Magnesium transport protein CorA n=1 Tax=Thermococcus gorgonarius TaxID=71997 RepID=A0A2Z2MDJ2_THEGO|nr:magnesium/cobalt transporter CorA [Thermococcus gorgonarius]ASJ00551.1 magnesium and cobalt transport protein CorA [Thermococcus gorgonarius]
MNQKSRIKLFAYSPLKLVEKTLKSPEEIKEYADYPVVWVNVNGMEGLEVLEELGFSGFFVRVLRRFRGSKAIVLQDQILLMAHQVYRVERGLKKEKTAFLLKGNLVVTIQERPGDVFNRIREKIRNEGSVLRNSGPDYLFCALLDATVENYVPIIEEISTSVERLEDMVLKRTDRELLRHIQSIRRQTFFLRRAIFPLLESFRKIRVEGSALFGENAKIYLEDLSSHVLEVLDLIESQRDMADGLLDIYYSSISLRTNEIMGILTVVSTIFIPLTFITGLYGMNFNPEASPYNMPELNWYYGYPAVLLLMLAIAVGMLVYFRRKGWI